MPRTVTDTQQGQRKGAKKRGRESFHFRFGRPRECIVASSPSCLAVLIIQSSLPKGRPRCALDRRSSNSEALSGSLTHSIQFCGRPSATDSKSQQASRPVGQSDKCLTIATLRLARPISPVEHCVRHISPLQENARRSDTGKDLNRP